jgi:hypothetical protein
MPVTDPCVAALGHRERIAGLIGDEGIEVVLDERSRVEPTLGGGSAMDSAKVADPLDLRRHARAPPPGRASPTPPGRSPSSGR